MQKKSQKKPSTKDISKQTLCGYSWKTFVKTLGSIEQKNSVMKDQRYYK